MLAAPTSQGVVIFITIAQSGFSRWRRVEKWKHSLDGAISTEAEEDAGAEETAWRRALKKASSKGLNPDLLSEMMDSAWLLRDRHKIPEKGLNPGNLKDLKEARAELERLARVALRSVEVCADAIDVLAKKVEKDGKQSLSKDEQSQFEEFLAGWFYFDSLEKAFSSTELFYHRTIDAAFYRNGYGASQGSFLERVWRNIRWLVGMQWIINKNVRLMPEDEVNAKEAANVVDVLYPDAKTASPTVHKLLNLKKKQRTMYETQDEGNDRRKLHARLTAFLVGVPIFSTMAFIFPLARANVSALAAPRACSPQPPDGLDVPAVGFQLAGRPGRPRKAAPGRYSRACRPWRQRNVEEAASASGFALPTAERDILAVAQSSVPWSGTRDRPGGHH